MDNALTEPNQVGTNTYCTAGDLEGEGQEEGQEGRGRNRDRDKREEEERG